jgi:6-phosphofructokinase 1
MRRTLGITVGGGPAPGINGVIASVTIEAINRGWKVLGFQEGFEWLGKGVSTEVSELNIGRVSRISSEGGSILGTSRLNPADSERRLRNTVQALKALKVDALVTIGGDDILRAADAIAHAAEDFLQVVHVPKTIDNDLRLPQHVATLGFETARSVGVELVANIMEDSHTTSRWYFAVTMGRLAGFLTLGIGKAAGATVTVIPEEFGSGSVSLSQICDVIEGSIIKRAARGKASGVALLAEGLSGRFTHDEADELKNIERDKEGHIRLGEIDLGRKVKAEIMNRFQAREKKITIVDKPLGYELRCAAPSPFDSEYARDLGFSAVKRIGAGANREMICLEGGKLRPIAFQDCIDPATGRGFRRDVDCSTESYTVARHYQERLRPEDLKNKDFLERAKECCGVSRKYLQKLLASHP